jgi:hypothetical protein
MKSLKFGYGDIVKTLKFIFEKSEEKIDFNLIGKYLFKKFIKLEYAILILIWRIF